MGVVKYRLIIDMGRRPNGTRHQFCETFDRLGDAKAKQAKIIADRSRGTLIVPTKITVKDAIQEWLDGRRNLRPSTQRNYRDSLKLVSDRLGHIQLQKLTKAQLDGLADELQKSGRRVGYVQRRGLGPRSVNLMLTLLNGVLDDAVKQGTLSRNVAKLVEHPQQRKKDMKTWTALHDARHTCGTLMHLRGAPRAVISKWLGHATASFTMATYVHSQDDALAAAGAMYGSVIRASQSGV